MTDIIVPEGFKSGRTPFADLCLNQKQMAQIVQGFTRILGDSFREDARRQQKRLDQISITEAEKKRRSEIMAAWFRQLRGDLHMSIQQCLDELPRALRAELDGGSYTPPVERKLWVPDTGAVIC